MNTQIIGGVCDVSSTSGCSSNSDSPEIEVNADAEKSASQQQMTLDGSYLDTNQNSNNIKRQKIFSRNSMLWKANYKNKETQKNEKLFYVLKVEGKDRIYCSLCDGPVEKMEKDYMLASKRGKIFYKSTTNTMNHLMTVHKDIHGELLGMNGKTILSSMIDRKIQSTFDLNLLKVYMFKY
ncbi:hypothetical protein WA158_002756 [Blastocystis sp. Blastoise]